MNKIKKLSVIAAAGWLGLGAVGQATAACSVTGKVAQGASTNVEYAYFYIAPLTTGVNPFSWYFYVPSANAYNLQMLAAATASGHTVAVTGNATACPTSGTYRYGGTVSSLNVYPRN